MDREPDQFYKLGVHKIAVWLECEYPHLIEEIAEYDSKSQFYRFDRSLVKRITDSLEVITLTRSEFFSN